MWFAIRGGTVGDTKESETQFFGGWTSNRRGNFCNFGLDDEGGGAVLSVCKNMPARTIAHMKWKYTTLPARSLKCLLTEFPSLLDDFLNFLLCRGCL